MQGIGRKFTTTISAVPFVVGLLVCLKKHEKKVVGLFFTTAKRLEKLLVVKSINSLIPNRTKSLNYMHSAKTMWT